MNIESLEHALRHSQTERANLEKTIGKLEKLLVENVRRNGKVVLKPDGSASVGELLASTRDLLEGLKVGLNAAGQQAGRVKRQGEGLEAKISSQQSREQAREKLLEEYAETEIMLQTALEDTPGWIDFGTDELSPDSTPVSWTVSAECIVEFTSDYKTGQLLTVNGRAVKTMMTREGLLAALSIMQEEKLERRP